MGCTSLLWSRQPSTKSSTRVASIEALLLSQALALPVLGPIALGALRLHALIERVAAGLAAQRAWAVRAARGGLRLHRTRGVGRARLWCRGLKRHGILGLLHPRQSHRRRRSVGGRERRGNGVYRPVRTRWSRRRCRHGSVGRCVRGHARNAGVGAARRIGAGIGVGQPQSSGAEQEQDRCGQQ